MGSSPGALSVLQFPLQASTLTSLYDDKLWIEQTLSSSDFFWSWYFITVIKSKLGHIFLSLFFFSNFWFLLWLYQLRNSCPNFIWVLGKLNAVLIPTQKTLPASPSPQPLHFSLNSPAERDALGNLDSTSISCQLEIHFKMFSPPVGFGDTRDSSLGRSKLPFQKSSSRFQRDNSNRQALELEYVTPRTLYSLET